MLQMIQKATAEEKRKIEERRIKQKGKNQQKHVNSCNKLKMLKKIETSSMLDWHRHTLFVHSSNSVQNDDLHDYIFWHVFRVNNTWARSFWHVFDELNAQYYNLQTIQSWKKHDESHWKSLNISADIDIQLTCDVSKYARSRNSDSDDKLSFELIIKDTSTARSRSSTSAQQTHTSTMQTWNHLYNAQAWRSALKSQVKISVLQILIEEKSLKKMKKMKNTLDDYSKITKKQHDELDYDESIYI